MAYAYHQIPNSYHRNCTDCWKPFGHGVIVAHERGEGHPMHLECAKVKALINNQCPKCFSTIDTISLFTWKEKRIIELKAFVREALDGTILGTFVLTGELCMAQALLEGKVLAAIEIHLVVSGLAFIVMEKWEEKAIIGGVCSFILGTFSLIVTGLKGNELMRVLPTVSLITGIGTAAGGFLGRKFTCLQRT